MQEIAPLTCKSVDTKNPIVVRNIAYIDVTFKESASKFSTVLLGCVSVPDSTEDLIIRKPTLDKLGFVSDMHSIELRSEDLRFSTVLPESVPVGRDSFLYLAENESFHASARRA